MKTILIADEDNALIRFVDFVFPDYMGYMVMAASSGANAILKAKEVKPDIVLADISLSDKNGYEVSREIKSDPLLKSTSVILLTASLGAFDETKAAEACADDFIIKPFEAKEVVKKVESLIIQSEKREIISNPSLQTKQIEDIAESQIFDERVVEEKEPRDSISFEMESRPWKIFPIHSGKSRSSIALLGLGVILLFIILISFAGDKEKRAAFSISDILAPGSTQPELNPSFETSPTNNKISEETFRKTSILIRPSSGLQFTDDKSSEETLREITPFERDTESEVTKEEEQSSEIPVSKVPVKKEKRITSHRRKEMRSKEEKQISEVLVKEEESTPELRTQKTSKWKIRK